MKAKFLVTMVFAGLLVLACGPVFAQSYTAETIMPVADRVDVTVSQIDPNAGGAPEDPATHAWSPAGATFDFGSLTEITGITTGGDAWVGYFPQYYFAIDIAMGGGGVPSGTGPEVTVAYSGPDALSFGMVTRVVLTASLPYTNTALWPESAEPATPDQRVTLGVDDLDSYNLKDLATAVTNPGWLRIYAGIATSPGEGEDALPAGAEPFTGLDEAGLYTGSIDITISAIGA